MWRLSVLLVALLCPMNAVADMASDGLIIVGLSPTAVLLMQQNGESYFGWYSSEQGGPWEPATRVPGSNPIVAAARVQDWIVIALTSDGTLYRGWFTGLPGTWELLDPPLPTEERIIGFVGKGNMSVLAFTESGRVFEGVFGGAGFWREVAPPPSVVDATKRSLGGVKNAYR